MASIVFAAMNPYGDKTRPGEQPRLANFWLLVPSLFANPRLSLYHKYFLNYAGWSAFSTTFLFTEFQKWENS